jgi:flagellar motor switch protein FliN
MATDQAVSMSPNVSPIAWEDFGSDVAAVTAIRPKGSATGSVRLRIELGHARVPRGELDDLRSGSVVPLDNSVRDSVAIRANGQLIARGELLAIDGRFGVRVVEFVAPVDGE